MSTPDPTPMPERPTTKTPFDTAEQPVAMATGAASTPDTATQSLPQIPAQQFPQSVEDVYQAVKNALMHSQSFGLIMADDVAKTASVASRNDGVLYMVHVVPGVQTGSVVQFVPQGQPTASLQMESMVFFGELNRELMMQQMNATQPQLTQQTWNAQSASGGTPTPKKPASWVLYLAIDALAVSVIALILLIVLTPKTGAWLVWVLGIVSLAFSGFSLYASLMLDKNLANRILSGVAVGISVLAIIFGCVNMPKAMTTTAAKTPSSSSSSSPSSSSKPSSSSSEEPSESPSPSSSESTANDTTQSTDNIKAPGAAGEALTAIGTDVDSAISDINNELNATFEKVGDTYASYNQNKQAIADWYAYVDSRTADLYQRIGENSGKFYTYIAQNMQNASSNEIDAVMEEYQDYVYEDQFKNLEDSIYEDAFEEMNDKYYEGVLERSDDAKKAEDEDYSAWYDVHSECYENWYDARSDFYENWFDMRSDTYSAWLDINSEFFSKDFDIQKYVDRYMKKASAFKS